MRNNKIEIGKDIEGIANIGGSTITQNFYNPNPSPIIYPKQLISIDIRELINKKESPKVDFKRQWYREADLKTELIKDIIALTNGNIHTIGQNSFLIIGVKDKEDGNELYDVVLDKNLDNIKQQLLHNLQKYTIPAIQDIQIEKFEVDSKNIIVIQIPFHPYLIILKEKLRQYSKDTLLYRAGEGIVVADYATRRAFDDEMDKYKKSSPNALSLTKITNDVPNNSNVNKNFIGQEKEFIERNAVRVNSGSGVIISIDNRYFVVTTLHCLSDNIQQEIVSYDNQRKYIVKNSYFYKNRKVDIALLEIDSVDENLFPLTFAKNSDISSEDEINIYGFSIKQETVKTISGRVLEWKNISTIVEIISNKNDLLGWSGSGVFKKNENGSLILIGVLSTLLDREHTDRTIINCISIKTIMEVFEYNNKINFWQMQLHEDNPKTPIEEILKVIETGYIGLDFGGTSDDKYFYESSSLENWYSKTENKKRFFLDIKQGDIVLIHHGAKPIALTKVMGEYEYTDNPIRPMWAKHRIKIEVLSYYSKFIEGFKESEFKIAQTRGTLSRSKSGKTYEVIDNWYKKRPINIGNHIEKIAQKKSILIYENQVKYEDLENLFEFNSNNIQAISIELQHVKNVKTLKFEFPFKKGLYTLVGENGVGKSSLLISLGHLVNGNTLRYEFKGDIFNDSSIIYSVGSQIFEIKRRETFNKNGVGRGVWRVDNDTRVYIEDIEINKFPKIDGFFESSIISGDRFEQLNRKKEVLSFVDKYNKKHKSIEEVSVDDSLKIELDTIINGKNTDKYENLFLYKSDKWNNKEVYFIKRDEHLISEYSFSTGEYFVLSLLKRINRHHNKNIKSLIIIDEIDISLHPKAQVRLAESLKRFAKEYNLIIIIATHSLPIIDQTEGKNLFYISRDKRDKINFENNKKSGLIASYLYEKVIFDRVILVEDTLAREFVEKVIDNTIKNNVLYTIIPIGGWEKVLEIYELNKYEKFLGENLLVILDGDVESNSEYIKNKNKYKDMNLGFLPIPNIEAYVAYTLLDKMEFQHSVKSNYLKRNNFDDLNLGLDVEFYFNLRKKFKDYINPTSNRDDLVNNFDSFVEELSKMKNNLDNLIENRKKGDKKTIYQKLKNEIIANSSLEKNDISEIQLDSFFIDEVMSDLKRKDDVVTRKFVGRVNKFLE